MPIYPYRCESCEHQFETLQRIGDEPLTQCPECGEPELRKLLTAAAFRLKGSGWYETDFKNKDKKSDKGKSQDKKSSDGDSSKESNKKSSDSGSDVKKDTEVKANSDSKKKIASEKG